MFGVEAEIASSDVGGLANPPLRLQLSRCSNLGAPRLLASLTFGARSWLDPPVTSMLSTTPSPAAKVYKSQTRILSSMTVIVQGQSSFSPTCSLMILPMNVGPARAFGVGRRLPTGFRTGRGRQGYSEPGVKGRARR
jgi:hypothetical protein